MTKTHRFAVVLGVLLLTGCTAPSLESPPSAEPTPSSAAAEQTPPPLDEADFDLVVTREFDGEDGPITCKAYLSAESYPGGDTTDADAASEFLAAYDASAIEVSLDDFEPNDLEQRRQQGLTDAQLLFMLVTDRIHDDVTAAGLFTTDVSLSGETRCE